MQRAAGGKSLERELGAIRVLGEWTRSQLYTVAAGGRRAEATTAVAAAAAEEAHRVVDGLPEWRNATSMQWRGHLQLVWEFLAGDETQFSPLSRAVADYLTSPLNHNDGQDGPDDFDRPQTVASYSAVLSVVTWGVDFAVTAVKQIFECIDLKYGQEYPGGRWADVQREIAWVQRVVTAVVGVDTQAGGRLPAHVLDAIHSPGVT